MPYCYDCGTEITRRDFGRGSQRIFCEGCLLSHDKTKAEPKMGDVTWDFIAKFESTMDTLNLSASRACLKAGVPKDWYSGTTRRLQLYGYARSSREKIERITKWIDRLENDSPQRRAGLQSP
jgi:hypothetical protein